MSEREREVGRRRNQERGGKIRATASRDLQRAKKSVSKREKEGVRGQAGRQMPAANAHRNRT